ncbi:MAG: hypothetical protein IKX48_13895 [Victivallales bacterium]|nr:hypothetical protein [Victivallales bacterium]
MMDRRDFIKLMAATTAVAADGSKLFADDAQKKQEDKMKVPERNRRPYSDVDWEHSFQIHTTSHGHCTSQGMMDGYLKRGFGLLTLSNYYPSAPYCPASKMTVNYYRVHHDFPVMFKGVRTNGPFDWNKIVEPWIGEVEEKYRAAFPFKEGGPMFNPLPEGILEAPNAEHHGFVGSPTHLCAPGSAFASGTFDARNFYKSMSHGYHFGSGEPWRLAIDRMIDGLIYPDGGGVTINHPAWSRLKYEHMMEMLDHDPRVLGIEVYNQGCVKSEMYPWSKAYCEDYWDYALGLGRQCFGFFVPDWSVTEGTNVLIVKEKTVHECLRAYRQGNWFGAIKGRGILNFTAIRFDGETLLATTDKKARFQVISKQGVVKETETDKLEFKIAKEDYGKHIFLRIKAFATDDSGEIIYSQPFMLD